MKTSQRLTALAASAALALTALSGCITINSGDTPSDDQPQVASDSQLVQGAAPSSSDITAENYDYTVKSYLDDTMTDLHQKWSPWFEQNGYVAEGVLYYVVGVGESNVSACNLTITDTTPNAYFCPLDNNGSGAIWLPVTTFQQMWLGDVLNRPSTQAGDFAAGIVTAHEYGHFIKHLLETQATAQGNIVSPVVGVNKELLADCFAGVWAASLYFNNQLEDGDFQEAVAALTAISDATPGGVDPHGTVDERVGALMNGYNENVDPTICITTYWK